jgi:hypothetical protein
MDEGPGPFKTHQNLSRPTVTIRSAGLSRGKCSANTYDSFRYLVNLTIIFMCFDAFLNFKTSSAYT